MTLNKKAADEQFFQRLVVPNHPHTLQNLLTHREKKMDDICTHMNRTFCWEFSFHCEKQKIRLVFSLHFSRSFESYVCAIYSFFLIRVHPRPRSAPRSVGTRLSVSREWNGKTRHIMMKSPGGVDRIKSNPDFKVCLHFSRSIIHTNSAGYCVGHSARCTHTHTHDRYCFVELLYLTETDGDESMQPSTFVIFKKITIGKFHVGLYK